MKIYPHIAMLPVTCYRTNLLYILYIYIYIANLNICVSLFCYVVFYSYLCIEIGNKGNMKYLEKVPKSPQTSQKITKNQTQYPKNATLDPHFRSNLFIFRSKNAQK